MCVCEGGGEREGVKPNEPYIKTIFFIKGRGDNIKSRFKEYRKIDSFLRVDSNLPHAKESYLLEYIT